MREERQHVICELLAVLLKELHSCGAFRRVETTNTSPLTIEIPSALGTFSICHSPPTCSCCGKVHEK